VNGAQTPTWGSVLTQAESAKPGDSLALVVARNGSEKSLTVTVPQQATSDDLFGYAEIRPVLDDVVLGTPADKAGMRTGDLIVSIDGAPVVTWQQLVNRVRGSDGRELHFVVRRDGKEIALAMTPVQGMDPNGKMIWQVGVSAVSNDYYERQSFVASAKNSVASTAAGIRQIGNVLAGLASGKVSARDLQGFIGIVRASGQAAKRGPVDLLVLTAVISLNLGLLNLLPIPILDGGHVLMLAIEGVMRRDLSIAFKERFVQVGLVFLLGLFAFVMYSDIMRIVQSHH
jgi:regulator of sigma E protease